MARTYPKPTAIEEMRKCLAFFDGINESINNHIRDANEAMSIWRQVVECYERDLLCDVVLNSAGRVRVEVDLEGKPCPELKNHCVGWPCRFCGAK